MSEKEANLGKKAIRPQTIPGSPAGYPAGIRAGDWVFSSGREATDFKKPIAPAAIVDSDSPESCYMAEVVSQTKYLYSNFVAVAEEAGINLDDNIVRIYQWFRSSEIIDAWPDIKIDPYLETRDIWLTHDRPASTGIGVSDLLTPQNHINVDWIAQAGQKESVATEKVPVPLAGYSQAVLNGPWVWLAGDTGTDWVGDEYTALHPDARVLRHIWYGQKVYNELKYIMKKQRMVLEEAGSSLDDVVKAEVYLAGPEDYFYFEKAWREIFPDNPPARSIYPNIGLGLRGSRVEVALIALKSGSGVQKEIIETSSARKPFGHEPQAIKAGDMLFISGQMACDEKGLPLVEPEPGFPYSFRTAQSQMKYIAENIAAICEAAGTTIENVCRRQAVFTNLHEFEPSWEVWRSMFKELPTETTLGVSAPLLSRGCTIYTDVMVYAP